jgi:hypothetical protein
VNPADLKNHVLLQYDDPEGRHPWLHWKSWLEIERIADLRPAGTMTFSGYEQIIPAAVAGHGVALGRSPLMKDLLNSGELVAPFKSSADPARAYYAIVAKNAPHKDNAVKLIEFLASDEGQKDYAEVNNEYPVKDGVPWSALVQSWGNFKADPISLNELAAARKKASELVDKVDFDAGPSS